MFLYTVDEYRRFANHLPVTPSSDFTAGYSEADYIAIQVRLMLLRKYYGGGKNENVSIKNILANAQVKFPNSSEAFLSISARFSEIEMQQIEHILSDGTKLNLYSTIEDTVYGLYLHADENRIYRLENTEEMIRFVCTRKYILEIEAIVFELYDLLISCGVDPTLKSEKNRAPMIHVGATAQNSQSVIGSPYWSNIYGHDASDAELQSIAQETTIEEHTIIQLCVAFTDELVKPKTDVKALRKYIHPFARAGWGDFKHAKEHFCSIPNPGFSTRVRYNEKKDIAYVRIFPQVEDAFVIDAPHLVNGVWDFALAKWRGEWRIYQFGGHLDSIYE